MKRVLFLCSRNACRSQMAEAWAKSLNLPDVDIVSAGVAASGINPRTVKVMEEVGIDMSGHKSVNIDDLPDKEFDVVITLCNSAAEQCPVLPGYPEQIHWNLANPDAAEGSDDQIMAVFRESRDKIKQMVDDFFNRGYFAAFVDAKYHERLILNNISDGILAHDMDRRIFYINRAAEELTGYSREDVMYMDCHDAFPGRFCGGKCLFCENSGSIPQKAKREIQITTKSGETKTIEMTINCMKDQQRRKAGVLVSFHDVTRVRSLERRFRKVSSFSGIIGRDEKMLEVFDLIKDLADSNAPVLIHGESGTGKELVAAAIHTEGLRGEKLFVPVNCGALPEALLESELFGHVKGAFTGAIRDKKGRFELADGGTIFLDEIGDISTAMQVKLLRVLQEGRFERVGSEKTMKVDVRVVSATNKDLQVEIEEGRFREDLFYRLNVVPLILPPLRDRRNDIPLLVEHILSEFLKGAGRSGVKISPEALDVMLSYDWPGNVRELQNWIQFALVKCRNNDIGPEHLPIGLSGSGTVGKRKRRKKLDLASVREALEVADNNKVEAAKLLGVSRATLYRFFDEMGNKV